METLTEIAVENSNKTTKHPIFLIQPTSACNMNCNYCYVPDRENKYIMDDSTLETSVKKIVNDPLIEDHAVINFHAGEPLMAGLSFYKKYMGYIKKYKPEHVRIEHNIQTNGLAITEKWCQFFKENNFTIGGSIDGPAFLHDENRVTWSNKPTHEHVVKGYKLLQDHDIQLGIICLLSLKSLDFPKEIYTFFHDFGCKSLGFNIEEIDGVNEHSSLLSNDKLSMSEVSNKYFNFMSTFFDLWNGDGRPFKVREFSSPMQFFNMKKRNRNYYNLSYGVTPLEVNTISRTGDIFTYCPELSSIVDEKRAFSVGNIHDISTFEDIQSNQNFQRMQKEIAAGVNKCRQTCTYFDYCGGGHSSAKFAEHKRFDCAETNQCKIHIQTLVNCMLTKLQGS